PAPALRGGAAPAVPAAPGPAARRRAVPRPPAAGGPGKALRGMTRRGLFLVPLLCAPIFLVGLGSTGLAEPGEGRNSEVGREMLETGDFVTPHINAAVYLDKPPVFFWAVAASVALFGPNETAARLPSALSAIAIVALTVWFARRWFGEQVAW